MSIKMLRLTWNRLIVKFRACLKNGSALILELFEQLSYKNFKNKHDISNLLIIEKSCSEHEPKIFVILLSKFNAKQGLLPTMRACLYI